MVGSAPWRRAQFAQKGVDALLAAVQQSPRLSLVFLWRGVLSKEMGRRMHAANVGRRVEVLNKRVDVNQVLSTVHGSIALTTDPSIIRPYPHSLLESLAAGKPVLVSKEIPMSDYVERNGCGVVVQSTEPGAILTAVASFVDQYAELQRCALRVGQRDFAQERMLASFRAVYERILAGQEQR
jgi:glycosyltransferase involved in cell wall biosynthesis